ncbi:MAG: hypothetical protein HZA91_10960 [Verrucomicrobia bacterium]|nr:hypothetical protein [Verrucomicrobiota bacterium]
MKTRHTFGTLILATLLVVAGIETSAEAPAQGREEHSKNSGKIERLGSWEEVTLEVHSMTNRPVERVRARASRHIARFTFRGETKPADVTVTVFATKSGRVWVGPEQLFYIETESGIVGGKMWGESKILWCESLINKAENQRSDLDSAVGRFEKEVSGPRLFDAYNGYALRSDEEQIKLITPFNRVLINFLGSTSGNPECEYKVRVVDVIGNTLCLDMKGPRKRCPAATLWIDIKSRKVVKAVENGKQVFPK